MNTDNLHELINRYEEHMDRLYDEEHNELYKWKAVKSWQDAWNRPAGSLSSFGEKFACARQGFSTIMDNSRMHPSTGVEKLWEKEPDQIEELFEQVLFAPDGGDISLRQDHMDSFLEEYEALRQKYYPGNWSYKQDRHSASVFLAVNAPEENFVYKSREAQTMARYTEFGLTIGIGQDFRLENYYRMCEEIAAALREHESLLEKHFSCLVPSEHYRDESLHMLVFDLMYCCRTYGFYQGLPVADIPRTGRQKKAREASEASEQKEAQRREKIRALEEELLDLEKECDACEDISLLQVQVTSKEYGTGTVIGQDRNRIRVDFSGEEKSFELSRKFTNRPHFENDEEIVEIFTRYAKASSRREYLEKKLANYRSGF